MRELLRINLQTKVTKLEFDLIKELAQKENRSISNYLRKYIVSIINKKNGKYTTEK